MRRLSNKYPLRLVVPLLIVNQVAAAQAPNAVIPFNESPVVQQFVTSESDSVPSVAGSLPTVGGDNQATDASAISSSVIAPAPAQSPEIASPTPVVAPTAPLLPSAIPTVTISAESTSPISRASSLPPAVSAAGPTLFPNAPNTTVLPIQPPPTDLPLPVAPMVQTILPTPYLLPVTQPAGSARAISGENLQNSEIQGPGQYPVKPDFVVERAPVPEFSGGINENTFVACERMITQFCTRAPAIEQFQVCLNQLKQQPGCTQFVTFASLAGFAPGSFVDLMQHYKEARLTLLHLSRGGENYAGDYFTLGANGDFVNITSGPEAQALDISKQILYAEIMESYPNAQLWSLVDQLPNASAGPNGQGLTLTFRFQILNGCANCERVGHAYVAYDFSEVGALKNVRLLKLEKAAQ